MLINREGQQAPDVTFRVRRGDGWQNLSTKDVFAGKTIVVFSLPGAFTPTGSNAPRVLDVTVFTRKGCPHCTFAKQDQQALRVTFYRAS